MRRTFPRSSAEKYMNPHRGRFGAFGSRFDLGKEGEICFMQIMYETWSAWIVRWDSCCILLSLFGIVPCHCLPSPQTFHFSSNVQQNPPQGFVPQPPWTPWCSQCCSKAVSSSCTSLHAVVRINLRIFQLRQVGCYQTECLNLFVELNLKTTCLAGTL